MIDTSSRSLRIFLCHSTADKPAVRELYQRLRADGFKPWLDEEDLLPGQDWQREIPKAVRQSDVVIVCLSKGSIDKAGYVQKEIRIALDVADQQPEDTIFLIPLKLEECHVPERLSRWQWVNHYDPNGYAKLIRSLRARAGGLDPTAPIATTPVTPPSTPAPSSTTSNVSGGVNVAADNLTVGNDVVGRDKIIQANTYIERAVFMPSTPALPPFKITAHVARRTDVQVWSDIEFVRILPGKFLMGSHVDNRFADENEQPQHTVEIPYGYWIARYPATVRQFTAFVEATRAEIDLPTDEAAVSDHPVVKITWHEANAYCQWLDTLARASKPSQGLVARLPTEAEWEKAARGVYSYEWPWGNEWDAARCNSMEGGKDTTTPVGAYSPQGDSPYGVADMVGNVWEWCHSLDRAYPYMIDDGRESEAGAGLRVVRGGAYRDSFAGTRCAYRSAFLPHRRHEVIGFRVVIAPRLV